MNVSEAELAQLIEPGRVHRRLYTDPAIFELEMARIFGAAWIYVGHESQVKNPGDYFCTRIGRKPVIMVRGADGKVRVIPPEFKDRPMLPKPYQIEQLGEILSRVMR